MARKIARGEIGRMSLAGQTRGNGNRMPRRSNPHYRLLQQLC
jgi:hypothetical protein